MTSINDLETNKTDIEVAFLKSLVGLIPGCGVTRNYKCAENGKLECTENGNNSAQLFYFQM